MTPSKTILQIISALVDPETIRLDKVKDHLIERNGQLTGKTLGFRFKGQKIAAQSNSIVPLAYWEQLHPDLHSEASAYLEDLEDLLRSSQMVKQWLSLVILNCKTWQDVRDALPDPARTLLEPLKALQRTRPEAWCIEGKPFAAFTHERGRKTFLNLLSNRMLY